MDAVYDELVRQIAQRASQNAEIEEGSKKSHERYKPAFLSACSKLQSTLSVKLRALAMVRRAVEATDWETDVDFDVFKAIL